MLIDDIRPDIGVFYEVDSDDKALAATEQCKIDAKLMKELGVNTVRVRNVDATTDSRHDGCMVRYSQNSLRKGIPYVANISLFSLLSRTPESMCSSTYIVVRRE